MSRVKKKRSFVSQYLPADKVESKAERLLDENSYESRKKKAQDKKKKHKSLYQREQEKEKQEKEAATDNGSRPKGGRLAEKIRTLNKNKSSD